MHSTDSRELKGKGWQGFCSCGWEGVILRGTARQIFYALKDDVSAHLAGA